MINSNSKELKRTLMDVRKMRRAVKMRRETDPEVVSQTLETILKEAIVLSSTSDGAMSKAAIKELQQVRRSLVAQQIDAGQNTAKYIGAYSAVLDNVESVTEQVNQESRQQRDEVMRSFQDSLPSSDTIISAIMTANPIFGYTLKMTRDLMGTARKRQKEMQERSNRENELRLESLKEQERLIEEQFQTNQLEQENAVEQKKERTGRRRGIYADALQGIRDEIKALTDYLNGQSDSLEKVSSEASESSESLERIIENDQKLIDMREREEADDGLKRQEALFESGDSGPALDDAEFKKKESEDEFGGMLGGILGGLTGGIAGMASALLTPFTSMFTFLKAGGKLLMKFGKFGVVFAAVKGIYDFIEGMLNASEIIGRDNIDWKDRMLAGLSNVLSGLLEPINWVTETLFGVDLMGGMDREELTKKYFQFFDNFTENIFGMAKWIFTSITDKIIEIRDDLMGFVDGLIPDWLRNLASDDEEPAMTEEEQKSIDQLRRGTGKATSSDTAARVADEMDRNSSESVQGGNAGGGSVNTFAPTSSQTNVNNHQYNGSTNSENREPTARRFSDSNIRFGFGP